MGDPGQKYRILEKLDSGGMAEIYRAEAESIQGFKKQVAIKRILPHLTKNPKFVAMFLDEAKLSLYLNHANIVHVFDIGRSEQTFFIVMEYVDGLNLRAITESISRQGRKMDLAMSLFVIMEVCKGLGYAHDMTSPEDNRELGIVHRDVSPPNILLSKMGEVKIVDFGLAKAASQLEHTDPGVVKGKFSYLSPEAANGLEVDWRTDIFACGIILFELLTGRRLFYGETDYQTVELVRQARVPSLTALNMEIPLELDRIVHQSLARDPAQRFQHSYELQDALAQFLFSRSLKVTNRDIAQLVRECMMERKRSIPTSYQSGSVINHLIQDEILKFTSLDKQGGVVDDFGSKPLSPDELISTSGAYSSQDLIDPRGWSNEILDHERLITEKNRKIDDDIPEVVSLEQMLEPEGMSSQAQSKRSKKSSGKGRGILIALIVFILLGAATVFVLNTLGFFSPGGGETNQDILIPE